MKESFSQVKKNMKPIKKKVQSKVSRITRGNLFEDLGFSNEESCLLAFKTEIHSLILKKIEKKGYTRLALEHIFDKPQPRISELMTGKYLK